MPARIKRHAEWEKEVFEAARKTNVHVTPKMLVRNYITYLIDRAADSGSSKNDSYGFTSDDFQELSGLLNNI